MDAERTIVVGVDASPAADTVLAVAQRLVPVLDAAVAAVHAGMAAPRPLAAAVAGAGLELEVAPGDPVDVLADRLRRPEAVLAVVGCRGEEGGARPAGHVSLGLLQQVAAPVVVVPPSTAPADRPLREVLLPLDGSHTTAAAAGPAVTLLSGAGLRLTVAHVFDAETVPSFVDQPHHGLDAWGAEFVARHAEDDVELVMRAGTPGAELLEVISDVAPDLVVLAWSQDLSPGRAATIRRLLEGAPVPLLVVPADGVASTTPPIAATPPTARDRAAARTPHDTPRAVGSVA